MKQLKALLLLGWAVVSCGSAYAQTRFFSRPEDLSDFGERTLMVVLENNSLMDASVKSAVEKEWKISKYAFCSSADFDRLKGDSTLYFLVRVKGVFKKEREPSMEFLSLLRGGPAGVQEIDKMAEVLSMPLQPLGSGDGYILPYLEAYVKVFQTHVRRIREHRIAARLGISWYSNRVSELKGRTVLLRKEDLSEEVVPEQAEERFGGHARIVEEEQAEQALQSGLQGAVISLCIAPETGARGAFCYKMILGTDDGDLYYYRQQKITEESPRGFREEDLAKLSRPFSEGKPLLRILKKND